MPGLGRRGYARHRPPGWTGQSYQSWSEAAARPCGGGAVVVDPDGAAACGCSDYNYDACTAAQCRASKRACEQAGVGGGQVCQRRISWE